MLKKKVPLFWYPWDHTCAISIQCTLRLWVGLLICKLVLILKRRAWVALGPAEPSGGSQEKTPKTNPECLVRTPRWRCQTARGCWRRGRGLFGPLSCGSPTSARRPAAARTAPAETMSLFSSKTSTSWAGGPACSRWTESGKWAEQTFVMLKASFFPLFENKYCTFIFYMIQIFSELSVGGV